MTILSYRRRLSVDALLARVKAVASE